MTHPQLLTNLDAAIIAAPPDDFGRTHRTIAMSEVEGRYARVWGYVYARRSWSSWFRLNVVRQRYGVWE